MNGDGPASPDEEHPTPSPRSPEEPMAFTRDELLHGTLLTWACFTGLVSLATLASFVAVDLSAASIMIGAMSALLAAVIGGAVFAMLMPFGALLAWAIGHTLRRSRRLVTHLTAYTLLGALIGFGFLAVIRGAHLFERVQGMDALAFPPAIAITLAVPLGWWLSARHARRDASAHSTGASRVDPDAVIEDALIDTFDERSSRR